MRNFLSRLANTLVLLGFIGVLLLPQVVDAKTVAKKTVVKKRIARLDLYNPRRHYGDEHVNISHPTSRCDTPSMRQLQVARLHQFRKDGEKLSVSTSTPTLLGVEYRKYEDGLNVLWLAMLEPYCGYGAFGVRAAQHSYEKTADHVRQRFTNRVAELKAAGKLNDPDPTSLAIQTLFVPTSTIENASTPADPSVLTR